MKKFLFAVLAAAICLGFFTLKNERVTAEASVTEIPAWTAEKGEISETDDGLNFRTGIYRYSETIDLENGGFTAAINVNGNFRREDTWFAFLLQSEYSDAIGKYKGVNVQFKPVSTQGVKAGEMPAYISTYNVGSAEGGGTAKDVATVRCSDIAERETPYCFNFSIFVSDGVFVVAYGIDSYTFDWSLAGVELNRLKLSLIFGGADSQTTDMAVTLKKAGEAAGNRFLAHACEMTEEADGGTKITESAKRQGKIFYPVALSATKEISVKFKINSAPAWFVNDNTDASWFGIMLSSSPNVCLPGSATVGTIIRAHELMGNGTMHVGGQFFYNGAYVAGYPTGTNLKRNGEYTEFIYSFGENEITMTLIGENERTATIPVDGASFVSGKAYLSFAFNDDRIASIIEYNEFGEEISRKPDPDVTYWDVTIGEIAEYGSPVCEADGKNVNLRGGQRVRLPIKLYGGEISEFGIVKNGVYEKIAANRYAVRKEGDIAALIFTDGLTKETGLGEKTYRIYTKHLRQKYNGIATDFTANFVDAVCAEIRVGEGVYEESSPSDVKFSFAVNDDVFTGIEGYGIEKNDCFYNPLTGNLYLKREYLKNLSQGNYTFIVKFEYTNLEIILNYVPDRQYGEPDNEQKSGCGGLLNRSAAGYILSVTFMFGIVLTKRFFGEKKR